MLSKQYRTQSDILWDQYADKEIDVQTLMTHLNQIKSEEIAYYAGSRQLQRATEIEIAEYELNKRRENRNKGLSPQKKFQEEIPNLIKEYREESKRYRNMHNFFQWVLIIGPVLATGATGALIAGNNFKWAAAIISISVSISAGATGYYKFREKGFYLQQTADAIEKEFSDAQLGIGLYEGKKSEDTLTLLIKRVQQLKLEQKTREQHLDQPPETKLPTN